MLPAISRLHRHLFVLRPTLTTMAYASVDSKSCSNLMQFFDDSAKWGETSVSAGRPWTKAELMLKGNSDLHSLWYILLKERNMLMTMQDEHNRCLERMPNPERFEKVEESMENLMLVVEERNRVDGELELGEWTGPTVQPIIDELGRPCYRLTAEHTQPRVAEISAQSNEAMWGENTVKWLRIYRENKLKRERERKRNDRITARSRWWRRIDYLDDSGL